MKIHAELPAGERLILIKECTADFGGVPLSISNTLEVGTASQGSDSIYLEPFILTDDGLTWGVLSFNTESADEYKFSLPGFQRPAEWGNFVALGKNDSEKFYLAGPSEHPIIRGRFLLRNTSLTYPMLGQEFESSSYNGGINNGPASRNSDAPPEREDPGKVVRFLEGVNWDVIAYADKNVEYFRIEPSSIPAITDNVYIRMDVDNGGDGLWFTGSIDNGTFGIDGTLTSTRGQLEFLDLNFRVQFVEAKFDRNNLFPEVSGQTRTTIRDSTGIPREIYAILYSRDPKTGEDIKNAKWENLKFRLVMDKPLESLPGIDQTQEEILSLLGYSTENIGERAPDVAGSKADNAFLRPIFLPMERSIKGVLQLDRFDIRPNIARSVTRGLLSGGTVGYGSGTVGHALFSSSSLVLGKYISNDFYLSYTGQLATGYNSIDKEILGVNHLLGLEYRVAPGLLFQIEFDRQFNKYRNKDDTRFWVRRYFSLRN